VRAAQHALELKARPLGDAPGRCVLDARAELDPGDAFQPERPAGKEHERARRDAAAAGVSPYPVADLPDRLTHLRESILTPIESRIIRWRFGLDNEDELTLKEIGDKYNLSRERIRQLQEQAIGKIRRQMRDF